MAEALTFTLQATDGGLEKVLKSTAASIDDVVDQLKKVATISGKGFADIERAVKGADHAAAKLGATTQSVTNATSKWSGALSTLGTGLAGAGTVVAGLAASLGAVTQQVTSNVVAVDNWAQRLGVSVDWMSRMQSAAGTVGLDVDGLGEALSSASEKLSEAASGGGDAAAVFAQLGVSLYDSSGRVRDIDAILPALADGLKGVSSDSDRVRLAMALFGEEGSKLVPVLLQGSGGLATLQARAGALGAVMSTRLVEQSRAFQQGLTGITTALQGTAQSVVTTLLPSLVDLLPKVTSFVTGLKDSSLVQQTLIPLLQGTAEALGVVADHLGSIERAWNVVNAAFNVVVSGTLAGIGRVVDGLATLVTGAARAAEVLHMPGTAAALRGVATTLDTAAQEARDLGKVAAETAEDWRKRNTAVGQSLGDVADRTREAEAAARKWGDAAAAAAKAAQGHCKGVEDAVDGIRDAYTELGLQSPLALARATAAGLGSLKTIAAASDATALQVQQAWEATKARLIAQYGALPREFTQIDAAIKAGNLTTARGMIAAFDGVVKEVPARYRTIPAALDETNKAIVAGAQWAANGAVATWTGAETPLMQSYDRLAAHIDRVNTAMGRGIQAGLDKTKAAIDLVAAAATNAFFAVAKSAEARIAEVRGFVEQQLGPAPEVAGVTIGSTREELEAQYGKVMRDLSNVGQDQLGMHGWAAAQRATLTELLRRIDEKLRPLQAEQHGVERSAAGSGGGVAFAGTGSRAGGTGTSHASPGDAFWDTYAQYLAFQAARATMTPGAAAGSGSMSTGAFGQGGPHAVPWLPASSGGTHMTSTPSGPIDFGYGLPGMARGGLVPGSGPADSRLARVSPGEFLLPPREVSQLMGMLHEAIPARQRAEPRVMPAITVIQNVYGPVTPRETVAKLIEALNEAKRRGELR